MIRHVEHGPDSVIILYVKGDVDLDTRSSLEAALDHAFAQGVSYLVINLMATSYIDSEGLACLIATYRRAEQSRVHVALVVTDERLISLFRITRLDELFRVYESDDVAVSGMRELQGASAVGMTTTTVGETSDPPAAANMAIYDGTQEGDPATPLTTAEATVSGQADAEPQALVDAGMSTEEPVAPPPGAEARENQGKAIAGESA